MSDYVCSICDKPIDGDPHTDDATGEDCHAECCPTCLLGVFLDATDDLPDDAAAGIDAILRYQREVTR